MNATILGLAILLSAPEAKDTGIVGEWIPESTTVGGKTSTPRGKGDTRYEFTADGKQMVRRVDVESKPSVSEYKHDAKAKPATIDIIIPRSGGGNYKLFGIYKIDGDTLTICTRAEGDRPTKFEANDGARDMIMTFKRAKKKE